MTAEAALTHPQPVKLTVDDFLLLDRSGAFARYNKTELIDGAIVAVNSQYRPHLFAKGELAYRLRRALEGMGSALYVAVEGSVSMPPKSMPQPDIILTSEPRGEGAIPLASVALLVEIADSTVEFDLGEKARIYAANGVPEYWVVNLPDRKVHRMYSPSTGGYAERTEVALGERLEAVTIAGLAVDTAGI